MKRTADGKRPEQVGKETRNLTQEELVELTRWINASHGQVTLCNVGDEGNGLLVEIEEQRRREWNLPDGTVAVVSWCNWHEPWTAPVVRTLSRQETDQLLEESESVAIGRLVAHYTKHPEDDGHPAYQLHRIAERRRGGPPEESGLERKHRLDASPGGKGESGAVHDSDTRSTPPRQPRDVRRTGANGVIAEEIPLPWVRLFSYDEWSPDDDADAQWSRDAAQRWAEGLEKEGYVYSGPDVRAEPEPAKFNGLWGTLQRVLLHNQAVSDADEAANRWAVSANDELPSEYVLDKASDLVVQLPENYEARIENPKADVDDAKHAETSWAEARNREGAPDKIDQQEPPDYIDEAWTNGQCDAVVLWLAAKGWRIECMLTGTEVDGWYNGVYGKCALYLCRRNRGGLPPGNPVWARSESIEPVACKAGQPMTW